MYAVQSTQRELVYSILEVITDYGSAFVTYGNEIESKRVRFSGQDPPDRIIRGG